MPLVPHSLKCAGRFPLFFLAVASLLICLHSAAAAQTATPTPTPLVTQLSMSGEEGEYISSAKDYLYKPVNSIFTPELWDLSGDGVIDQVRITVDQLSTGQWFMLEFGSAGLNRNLAPGYYGKVREGGSEGNPNMYIAGNGNGCAAVYGSFNVHEIKIDYSTPASPRLVNFAVSFEQRCDGATPSLLGTVYYRYTGSQPVHSISGRLADSAGNPVANAKVGLNGSKITTTTTDADGNYTFTKLISGGNYRVVPTPTASYVYSPPRRKILRLSADLEANFAAVPLYKIIGRVTDENGAPIVNVPVALNGAKIESGGTDSKGYYRFNGLRADGNYTVTVLNEFYRFTPSSHTFHGLPGNQTLNFKGTRKEYVIGGQILDGEGLPMVGLIVNLGGNRTGAVKTDANGRYQFRNLKYGGHYIITPTKAYYRFFPGSLSYSGLSGSWNSANFTGAPRTHTLAGLVLDSNANPLTGVTMTLSGSQSETTVTDEFGRYSFGNLPAGASYTITPSSDGRTFTPPSRSYKLLDGNIPTINFISSP